MYRCPAHQQQTHLATSSQSAYKRIETVKSGRILMYQNDVPASFEVRLHPQVIMQKMIETCVLEQNVGGSTAPMRNTKLRELDHF